MHHQDGASCELCQFKLTQAHPFLVDWFNRLKKKYVNVHVAWSFRNEQEQAQVYANHQSNVQWPLSAHNNQQEGKPCALALDLFLICEDGVAKFPPLFYAKVNQENIDNREPLLWGGNFRKIADRDHFEIDLNRLNPSPEAA